MNDINFERDYSFVVRGSQRRKVILTLAEPITVVQVKKITELSLSDTSRAIRSLVDAQLAVCLTPKEKLGRVYELTKRGHAVREKLKKLDYVEDIDIVRKLNSDWIKKNDN